MCIRDSMHTGTCTHTHIIMHKCTTLNTGIMRHTHTLCMSHIACMGWVLTIHCVDTPLKDRGLGKSSTVAWMKSISFHSKNCCSHWSRFDDETHENLKAEDSTERKYHTLWSQDSLTAGYTNYHNSLALFLLVLYKLNTCWLGCCKNEFLLRRCSHHLLSPTGQQKYIYITWWDAHWIELYPITKAQ